MSETQAASSSDSYDTLPPPLPHPLVVRLKRKASPIPLDDVGRDRIPEGTDGQADNDEDGVLSLRVSHIESAILQSLDDMWHFALMCVANDHNVQLAVDNMTAMLKPGGFYHGLSVTGFPISPRQSLPKRPIPMQY
ncbi:MAG: hypothetical protein CYPHOPRED_004113 [Cyphobasidiales sp. Tagirdzhanova-0007]|nr:MAG: hypothetical protein CYPHOPRED_004113 [Cyphobasidiales sp. Tagirdzhanova-0007]